MSKLKGLGLVRAGCMSFLFLMTGVNAADIRNDKGLPMLLKDGDVVVFQGDSVTDGFRNVRERFCEPEMGIGYVKMARDLFAALYPDVQVTFINRGRSGDTIKTMRKRWVKDCLDLNPTWVSIMIGINDVTSHNAPDREHQEKGSSVQEYEALYRQLLDEAKARHPGVRFVLMEPYCIPYSKRYRELRPDLNARIAVVRKLADEYGALLIRTDEIMNKADKARGVKCFWTVGDGVHPKAPGCMLMAVEWLRALAAM